MISGVVVSFDRQRGFGFIRSRAHDEDVFVHARVVEGGRALQPGQRVRFEAEPSERGPRAVRVEPGKLGLAPDAALAAGLGVALGSGTLLFRLGLGWGWLWAWLGAINLVSLAAFAIDKRRALRQGRRISEKTLLALALIGGSPGSAVAMPLLRHKTRKESFRLKFAAVVVAQVIAAAALWWLRQHEG